MSLGNSVSLLAIARRIGSSLRVRVGVSQSGHQKIPFQPEKSPNTACSRSAQLPKLSVRFDGW